MNVYANKNYTLYVELSNGRSGIFDVKPYLEKGVFRELKDQKYFQKVKPFFCGIAWPNEQDLRAYPKTPNAFNVMKAQDK